MGNYFACPCPRSSTEGVVVMRSDGSLLKLKKGVHAREVMETHAGQRLVRCCSDRRVVMGSVELESNRLYFLVPEGSEKCRETYEKFWRVGESKGLLPPRRTKEGNDGGMTLGRALVLERSEVIKRSSWTPTLKTIEEITTPSLNSHAQESFPAVKV
ncbi:putative Metabotropic glutamate receptor 5 [Cocos nucifera]|uniref:Putative Metabotropic glutamate receptor 5 n=1 Tax=Cocos nucifera TaxID=13894 RepID=A0A8K0I6B5_COCNU|nr:putative Metabotropic glutamate receptor 5 [Cocos nucifera]